MPAIHCLTHKAYNRSHHYGLKGRPALFQAMGVGVCACRLARNKARRLSTPQAQEGDGSDWAGGTVSTVQDNTTSIRHLQKRGRMVGVREEVSSACVEPWPICTPVLINEDPAVLIQRERAERGSRVGQVANSLAWCSMLLNEVMNKTNEVKEGKKCPPDQIMLWQKGNAMDPGVTVILNK